MVRNQLLPNRLTDAGVTEAIIAVPRERFVPKSLAGVAYLDEDILLGRDRYLMEPRVFARLLQAAEIDEDDVVLDVGCGNGYSAAVISYLAGAVVALEEDEELARNAGELLAELERDNVAVVSGSLRDGNPSQGPYDVVFVNGSIEAVPDALVAQLSDGGRLLCVVGGARIGKATLVVRRGETSDARPLFDAAVPPLPGFARAAEFAF
jgi:protein-L-isoaspartate(D-aspartate) O-methyltransferase